jgi:hypothetical protein
VAFSQTAYEQKYLAHLKRLKDFDEKTKDSNIVPRIRKHLLKMGRYVTFKCKRMLYLISFTGSMPRLTTQVPSLSLQIFRKTISRRPRRNGKIWSSRRVKIECRFVLGLGLCSLQVYVHFSSICKFLCAPASNVITYDCLSVWKLAY